MGTAIASLTGYGRPAAPPSQAGQVPTYNPDFAFEAFATAGDIQSSGLPGGQTIVGGTVNGDNLTLTPSSGGGGDIVVTGGGIVLENNQAYWCRNASGIAREILKINASNQTEFFSIDGGGIFQFNTLSGTAVEIEDSFIRIPNGGSTNAGLQFQGGGNSCGFYLPGSNNIGVTLFSVEEFRFQAAGFGVGSINCAQNLVSWGTSAGGRDVALTRSAPGVIKVTNGSNGSGTPSNAPFAQLDFRAANFATAGRPTTGNAGRVIYDSDLGKLILDNGTAWVNVDGTDL